MFPMFLAQWKRVRDFRANKVGLVETEAVMLVFHWSAVSNISVNMRMAYQHVQVQLCQIYSQIL